MSKLTDFLKMWIWDIEVDKNKAFDYKKSIADNLVIIDSNAKSINENMQINNNKITQLTNNQKLSSINNLENIIIKDAAEANCDLKLNGNSKQDTIATLDTPAEIKNCKNNINLKLQNENLLIEGYSTPKSNTNFYSASSSNFIPQQDGWGRFVFNNTTGSATVYINAFLKLDYFRRRLKANTAYRIVVEFRNLISENIYDYMCVCGGTPEEAFIEQRSYTLEQIKTNNKFVTYMTTKSEATLKNTNLLLRSFASVTKGSNFSVECRVLISEDTNIKDYILGKEKTMLFPLQVNQKLMLGDYLAEDKVHKKRKQIVITEDMLVQNLVTTYTKLDYIYIKKPTNFLGYNNSKAFISLLTCAKETDTWTFDSLDNINKYSCRIAYTNFAIRNT